MSPYSLKLLNDNLVGLFDPFGLVVFQDNLVQSVFQLTHRLCLSGVTTRCGHDHASFLLQLSHLLLHIRQLLLPRLPDVLESIAPLDQLTDGLVKPSHCYCSFHASQLRRNMDIVSLEELTDDIVVCFDALCELGAEDFVLSSKVRDKLLVLLDSPRRTLRIRLLIAI